jgi:hypothetical protein
MCNACWWPDYGFMGDYTVQVRCLELYLYYFNGTLSAPLFCDFPFGYYQVFFSVQPSFLQNQVFCYLGYHVFYVCLFYFHAFHPRVLIFRERIFRTGDQFNYIFIVCKVGYMDNRGATENVIQRLDVSRNSTRLLSLVLVLDERCSYELFDQ